MFTWLSKTSCLVVCGLSQIAVAAESNTVISADDGIEEIIVRGSKMNLGVKEVPIAVTLFDKEMIEQSGMVNLRDIDDYAPNVSISQIGQVGGTYISIRGIESNPFIVNRTAVYIDGIPYREPDMLSLHNVSTIEILRGPQGTLYGSNADAGVIVISTQTPYQEISSSLGLNYNTFSSGSTYTLNGSISGGLTDDLTAIANIEYQQGDSFIKNISSSVGLPGEIENIAASSKFRYLASDDSQLDVIFFYNKLNAPGLYEQEFPALNIDLYNTTYADSFNGGQIVGDFEQANDAPKKTNEEEFGAALAYQHDFGENTLHVSASYRKEDKNSYGADFDLTSMPFSAGANIEKNNYLNIETRLVNLDNQGVDWLIGASFFKDNKERQLMTLIGAGGFDDYISASQQSLTPQSWALFGQTIYPITDKLNITTGLRYENSQRVLQQQAGVLDLGALGVFSFPQVHEKTTSDAWVPKLSLDYKMTEASMVYLSAAKGFIPGGYNLVAADQGDEIAKEYGAYDDEELWSYELGGKSELFDGRAFISAALFYIDAKSWQEYNILTDSEGRILSTVLINSDASVKSKGFEVELKAQATPSLQVIAGFGYIDAKYDQYHFSADEDYSGNKVKMVPQFDVSFSLTYDLTENWYMRTDIQGLGETALHQDNSEMRDTQWLLGLSSGYQAEHWSLRLYAKNLTNERYASELAYKNFLLGDDGNSYAPLANPRELGLTLDWRF